MGKFLLGVLVGVIVVLLGLAILGLAVGRMFASKQPTVAANSVLVLTLQGDVPESAPIEIPIPLIQSRAMPTVRDLWASLHEAVSDDRIKAIVIQPRNLTIGWGKLEELQEELVLFKRSGKPVYAMLQSPGSREYYLASAADKIYVSPDDMVEVKGFAAETMYLKGALDKLGVNVQVDHIGAYKDAGDMFTKSNMSPETREVLNQALDQIYGDFATRVGKGRHKTPDEIRALVDQGPYIARQAKVNGLVDELGYEDQVYADLKKKLNSGDLKKINIRTYARAVPGRGDRIAVIVGQGDIVRNAPENSFGSEAALSAGAMRKVIRQVRDDSSIKGAIVRVDSPGGDSVASDEILHELKLLSHEKPIVISMSDVAASGGYFISMTGDPVLAYPSTITGSIGVLYIRPNAHDLFNKIGLQEEIVSRGKFADMDSLYNPLSEAAREKLHSSIQATYQSFVSKVAAARKRTYEQIDPLAQGRVWMGAQARQNGLVDELGGFDRAISLIRQRAKLPPSGDTNLIVYPIRRSLIEVLTTASPDSVADAAGEAKLRKMLPALPSDVMLRGGLVTMLPYQFSIH
ncbi:MAG: signal peptide peptidase SppA, type [Bryobacterales bacterium]|nr:signal peptide peptidase SppA, type [Bryobacterales bacterium]